MPTDPVVQVGSPVLRHIAQPVAAKDFGTPKLTALLKKMSRLLSKEEFGVALAAPQVGVSSRIFIIAGHVFAEDTEGAAVPPDKVFINPEILRLSRKKKEMSEGCLSVRGKYGLVLRHERASVRAQDASGKIFTYHGTGLVAHIFQHECDHLDGILYIDKAEQLHNDTPKSTKSTKSPKPETHD